MSFQLPAILTLCQDACQHLMLHPYLKNKQLKLIIVSVVRIQVVWCLLMNNSWVNENTVSSSSELNHLFIADSLQLTNLTSRFGGAASFATSISFEKLDRSLSSSCPYCSRKFSAILAASQPYFVDILFIRINLKGGSKSFSLQSALFSSYKAF